MTRTAWERRVGDVAELLAWTAHEQAPTLGAARLVCIDGPAGAGKTTLGRALLAAATELGSSRLLHMDDMYEGWSGLGAQLSARIRDDLLAPLAAGRRGRYRRYDWHRRRFAEWHTVQPVDLLVLEGVGSGSVRYADRITLLVWVDAPRELRLHRGLVRDGEEMRDHWERWMRDEQELFAQERTRDRADVVIDGTGESERAVVFQ